MIVKTPPCRSPNCWRYLWELYLLGERDCSIQRRRQKRIEETLRPILSTGCEKRWRSRSKLAKEANYHSVGTVEFLVDEKKNFYFMEMNTRFKSSRRFPKTLTGLDLVKEQIRHCHGGKTLDSSKRYQYRGHVMEFPIMRRSSEQFAPCPGRWSIYSTGGASCARGYGLLCRVPHSPSL